MLLFEVDIETAQALPAENGEGGIQHVEIGHLDIAGVNVVETGAFERDAAFGADLVAHRRRAGRHTQLTDKRTVDEMQRSEEHTSELQSLMRISYAVFCLKKKISNQFIRQQ